MVEAMVLRVVEQILEGVRKDPALKPQAEQLLEQGREDARKWAARKRRRR